MRADVLFFLLIIGFFFLVWVATGGPTRPISFAGPFITPITGEGQTQSGYGTSTLSRYKLPASSRDTPVYSDGGTTSSDSSGTALPAGFGTPSPYRGEITMSEPFNPGTSNTGQEYIVLNDSGGAASIDITGWKIESTVTGNNVTLPGGTKLVHQGSGNITGAITLTAGQQAYLITSASPIGLSFQSNECIGYFDTTFSPSLSDSCPSATDDFNAHYSGNPLADDSCYAFAQSVNSCKVPSVPDGLTTACQVFVSRYLNYNGCAAAHSSDPGFYGKTWYVYLNKNAKLWKPTRENLKLLDASGKTVDMITY